MVRTAGSIGMPYSNNFPPAGNYSCVCVGVERTKSKVKHTPAIRLQWDTDDKRYSFEDTVYVTAGTLKMLNLIAQRVCNMPDTMELPDADAECANTLAGFILNSIRGKRAVVTIVENEEEYIDDDGRKRTKMVKGVMPFSGYNRPREVAPIEVPSSTPESFDDGGDCPF